jgi:pimeloyl-ACP methyl ester carboxylesterase
VDGNTAFEAGTKFVNANGIRIAYRDHGHEQNPPLVLIAGIYNQLIRWPDEFIYMLVDHGFRVIRFDNRDIGLTEKMVGKKAPSVIRITMKLFFGVPVDIPYTLDDMANDTIGLLDALEIDKAHVVGMSMGGMIAQLVTILHPKRVLSLTSIMSTTGALGKGGASFKVARQMVAPVPKDRTALENSVITRQMFGSPAYPQTDAEVTASVAQEFKRSNNPAGYLRQMAAVRLAPSRNNRLKRVKVPTLIIHGNQDLLVDVSGGVETKKCIEHAKFVRFEGMGHNLPKVLLPQFADLIKEIASDKGN